MSEPLTLLRHFRSLKDPRINRRRRHSLDNILFIAICAVVCGAETFQDIALFGERRREWLSRFLDLSGGVPSHDTIERVFARLDPHAFQRCFARWMTAWHKKLTGKHLAIDGKTVCGSADPRNGLRAFHLVNVWATEAKLCLGVVACEADSNEITAIPKLLELLDLEGALVTIDAMGCQKKIVDEIIEGGGDYLLVVKKNQENLHNEIEEIFEAAMESDFEGVTVSTYSTTDENHGREENRRYVVMPVPETMKEKENWKGLKTIGACSSERKVGTGKCGYAVRYFIGSKDAKARYYGKTLRNHWRVENSLHWRMDVVFDEDGSRVRERNAAENLAVVRRLALNMLGQERTKMSIAKKQFAAALDTEFLEIVIKV